jgi:hypothetical protein
VDTSFHLFLTFFASSCYRPLLILLVFLVSLVVLVFLTVIVILFLLHFIFYFLIHNLRCPLAPVPFLFVGGLFSPLLLRMARSLPVLLLSSADFLG